MIKVCHIVNLITGQADGVFTHLKMIFQNYDKNRFEHFVIYHGGDKVDRELRNLDIKFYQISSLGKKVSLCVFKSIYSILKKENPLILHTHLIKPYALTGLINLFFNKVLIFNYHGSFIQNEYNTRIDKIIYRALHNAIEYFHPTDLVLVPSLKSKELLLNETKKFKEIRTYYNGFDGIVDKDSRDITLTDKILRLRKQGAGLICVISRINREKRADRAIKILQALIKENRKVHLFIFGDGDELDALKTFIDIKNLEKHVTIPGFVENAKDYLDLFEILLITSDREGMPFVLWEALGKGVPVVASDVGGIREILEEYKCGFVFSKENIEKAVEKISRLISNEDLRREMGQNGIRITHDYFNSDNFIELIENTYYSLLKSR